MHLSLITVLLITLLSVRRETVKKNLTVCNLILVLINEMLIVVCFPFKVTFQ